MDHELITEFGWSTIRWENGNEIQQDGHLVVKEHQMYTNSKYVPENRSVWLPTAFFRNKLTFHLELQFRRERDCFKGRLQDQNSDSPR